MTKSNKGCLTHLLRLGLVLGLGMTLYQLQTSPNFGQVKEEKSTLKTSQPETKVVPDETTTLPEVSLEDWELVLVNANQPAEDWYPELTQVGPIWVDSRIAEATAEFLAAAQTLNPNEQLILGYRSAADQQSIFDQFVAQELAADPSLTQETAVSRVQSYFESGGTSDHQTGLGIDMSEVQEVNAGDPSLNRSLRQIAAKTGFVQRYPADKEAETGVGYEDWHWRYVGVDSAQYMLEHNLSLEEYRTLLEEQTHQD